MVVSETLEVSAETDVESEDMLPPYCVNKNSEDSESLKDIEDDCDTPVSLPTPDVTDCSDDITITTDSDLPSGPFHLICIGADR
mgnify:CR=1 FL=1